MSRYLAAYDISSSDRRESVARILLNYGHRLQRSVFELWLEPDEIQGLCRDVGPHLAKTDLFQLFPLDDRGTRSRISWQQPGPDFSPVIM